MRTIGNIQKALPLVLKSANYRHYPNLLRNKILILLAVGFNWGMNEYLLLCINRFSNCPSAKIKNYTSSNTVIEFLHEFYLHGFPISIRVVHASCFTSQDFKLFCDSNNIKLIFQTVGKYRSNGLVEKLVHTVQIKLLAMTFEHQKTKLYKKFSRNKHGIFALLFNHKYSGQPSNYTLGL